MSVQILLIDDHPLFVDGFVGMIRESRPNWHTEAFLTAADGCAALAQQSHWDLAIVDIQLPDADGFETIARMAELNAAVPRIIISGREDEAARFRARRAGASGFIVKSLAAEAMLGVMDSVLSGAMSFVDAAPDRGVPNLSQRQIDVLLLLAEGHANDPHLTVTITWITAKALLIDGQPQAAMSAFMAGKIKVEGDMGVAMQLQGVMAKLRG